MIEQRHLDYLSARGVSDPSIMESRGYESVPSGLRIPIYMLPDSVPAGYETRYDNPAPDQPKFIRPQGQANHLNVSPLALSYVKDARVPLWIVEGTTRADALLERGVGAISINGCYGWRGADENGSKKTLSDWDEVPVLNRDIVIGLDGDVQTNYDVNQAARRLAKMLLRKGAKNVDFIILPATDGLDDYLAKGNTVYSLGRLMMSFDDLVKIVVPRKTKIEIVGDFSLTDRQLAEELVSQADFGVSYVVDLEKWAVYDGKAWFLLSSSALVKNAVAKFLKQKSDRVAKALEEQEESYKSVMAIRRDLESSARTTAVMLMVQALSGAQSLSKAFNSNPWVITCQNGVLNLRSGELQPHDKSLLLQGAITCNYVPDVPAHRWELFLEEIMPDEENRIWLQKFFGQSLLGSNKARLLPVFMGRGANGKSVLLRAIGEVLGTDFQSEVDKSILISSRMESHPTKYMALKGKRLVSASETEAGDKFAAASLKQLTGGDEISARGMRQDQQTFKPSHSMVLLTNSLPNVDATDKAMWDRIKLIKFEQDFSDNPDRLLPEKLAAEKEGILAWLVQGLLRFLDEGLEDTLSIVMETGKWRMDVNSMAQFLAEQVVRDPKGLISASDLSAKYEAFCHENEVEPMHYQTRAITLKDFGATEGRTNKSRGWKGIRLKTEMEQIEPEMMVKDSCDVKGDEVTPLLLSAPEKKELLDPISKTPKSSQSGVTSVTRDDYNSFGERFDSPEFKARADRVIKALRESEDSDISSDPRPWLQ